MPLSFLPVVIAPILTTSVSPRDPSQVRLRFHPARRMQLLLPLPHRNPVRIHRHYHHPRIHTVLHTASTNSTTYSGSCIALDGDGEAVWCVDALDGDGGINQLGIGDASDDKGSNLFEFAPAAISSSTGSMTMGNPKKEMGLGMSPQTYYGIVWPWHHWR
ncbi:hypothetical protein K469DRAFT_718706 [Zopfia rhizophila CBS 207.26]|uniref:Uncharacterized protein n=1 Tax=Zopfia rhizophila CBS 207.26 TaxID=1314779 RepID=A0A6A6EKK4_9PEZI|nr:hypothetical protein K469DRAFT_718706 [Zopfia rhizophila CBS 207.26]